MPKSAQLPPLDVEGQRIILEVTNGWLVARDAGEWGGDAVFVGTDGTVERFFTGNVFAFARVGDALFALTGLAHMGFDFGTVERITVEGNRWRSTPLVALPGAPMGFRVVDGKLVVVTSQDVAAISVDGDLKILACR